MPSSFDEVIDYRTLLADGMCEAVDSLVANYNDRYDDSIYINGFTSCLAQDLESGDMEAEGALFIDLSDKKSVDLAMESLKAEDGGSILECSTYIQTLFFMALVDHLPEDSMFDLFDDNYTLVITPVSAKPVTRDSYHGMDDFFEYNFPSEKAGERYISKRVRKGDFVYIENYDNYPTDSNGAYGGEWCIVTDDSDKNNPTFFGFGIGYKTFKEVQGILHKEFVKEVKVCKLRSKFRKRPKGVIGISCHMTLKDMN